MRCFSLLLLFMILALCQLHAQDDTPPSNEPEKIRLTDEQVKNATTQSAINPTGTTTTEETNDIPKKKKKRIKPDRPFFQRVFKPEEHAPLTATAYSLVLPGAGQVYNKKYWKLPIVYGALGGMSYLVYRNTQNFRTVRDAYLIRVDDDPNTIDQFVDRYSDGSLNALRLDFKEQQELTIIGLSVVYVLVAVDAFVDAHMIDFDVDDDLSLGINPTLLQNGRTSFAPGLSFTLYPKKRQTRPLFTFE